MKKRALWASDLARVPLRVAGGTSVDRVARNLEGRGAAAAVVLERGHPAGAVGAEELTLALRHGLGTLAVRRLLLGGVARVRPAAPLWRVRHELLCRGASLVAVVSRGGAELGVIARAELPPIAIPAPCARMGRAVATRLATAVAPGTRRLLRRVYRLVQHSGGKVYLAGGAVRDALLKRAARDLDLVVEGDLAAAIRALGGAVQGHAAFETARAVLADGMRIDLARARRESYVRPAALPAVTPATLFEDLLRRDFTVNAMAVPLRAHGFGPLLDPFGGWEDLRRRRFRVLQPLSFVEDPTRAFRAVRLEALLGLKLEPYSARLLDLALAAGAFSQLSGSRLRREIELSFSGPRLAEILEIFTRNRVLEASLPGLRVPRGTLQAFRRATLVLERYRSHGTPPQARDWVVALGVLLRSTDRDTVARLLDRLRPDRSAREALRADLTPVLRRLSRTGGGPRSAIYRICRGQPLELLLTAAAVTAKPGVRRGLLLYLERDRWAVPDISGRDVLEAGVGPGPAVAQGLEAALLARLDGRARSAEEQLRYALRAARRT